MATFNVRITNYPTAATHVPHVLLFPILDQDDSFIRPPKKLQSAKEIHLQCGEIDHCQCRDAQKNVYSSFNNVRRDGNNCISRNLQEMVRLEGPRGRKEVSTFCGHYCCLFFSAYNWRLILPLQGKRTQIDTHSHHRRVLIGYRVWRSLLLLLLRRMLRFATRDEAIPSTGYFVVSRS